jgi:hypothetical protein
MVVVMVEDAVAMTTVGETVVGRDGGEDCGEK